MSSNSRFTTSNSDSFIRSRPVRLLAFFLALLGAVAPTFAQDPKGAAATSTGDKPENPHTFKDPNVQLGISRFGAQYFGPDRIQSSTFTPNEGDVENPDFLRLVDRGDLVELTNVVKSFDDKKINFEFGRAVLLGMRTYLSVLLNTGKVDPDKAKFAILYFKSNPPDYIFFPPAKVVKRDSNSELIDIVKAHLSPPDLSIVDSSPMYKALESAEATTKFRETTKVGFPVNLNHELVFNYIYATTLLEHFIVENDVFDRSILEPVIDYFEQISRLAPVTMKKLESPLVKIAFDSPNLHISKLLFERLNASPKQYPTLHAELVELSKNAAGPGGRPEDQIAFRNRDGKLGVNDLFKGMPFEPVTENIDSYDRSDQIPKTASVSSQTVPSKPVQSHDGNDPSRSVLDRFKTFVSNVRVGVQNFVRQSVTSNSAIPTENENPDATSKPYEDENTVKVREYNKSIVAKLLAHVEAPDQFKYNLVISPTDVINGTIGPDENNQNIVTINKGLLSFISEIGEGGIAYVLAHEMGHYFNGDTDKIIDIKNTKDNIEFAKKVVKRQIYSKEQEYRADLFAVRLMIRAGYDPEDAIRVLKKLESLGKADSISEIMGTHPASSDRILAIVKLVGELEKNENTKIDHVHVALGVTDEEIQNLNVYNEAINLLDNGQIRGALYKISQNIRDILKFETSYNVLIKRIQQIDVEASDRELFTSILTRISDRYEALNAGTTIEAYKRMSPQIKIINDILRASLIQKGDLELAEFYQQLDEKIRGNEKDVQNSYNFAMERYPEYAGAYQTWYESEFLKKTRTYYVNKQDIVSNVDREKIERKTQFINPFP